MVLHSRCQRSQHGDHQRRSAAAPHAACGQSQQRVKQSCGMVPQAVAPQCHPAGPGNGLFEQGNWGRAAPGLPASHTTSRARLEVLLAHVTRPDKLWLACKGSRRSGPSGVRAACRAALCGLQSCSWRLTKAFSSHRAAARSPQAQQLPWTCPWASRAPFSSAALEAQTGSRSSQRSSGYLSAAHAGRERNRLKPGIHAR